MHTAGRQPQHHVARDDGLAADDLGLFDHADGKTGQVAIVIMSEHSNQ